MGPWDKYGSTVVRIDNVEDIKICVINNGGEPFEFHFVSIRMS